MKDRICSICGSDKYYAKGMCKNCYYRKYRAKNSPKVKECPKCGEPGPLVKGLCISCYHKEHYVNKKEQEKEAKITIALNNIKFYQDIISMISEGHTYEEIGKKYGISRQRVHQIFADIARKDRNKI